MEKSLAEGSQTFEQDLARLINDRPDHARRRPGLRRFADQPDVAPAERHDAGLARSRRRSEDNDDQPSFTEITIDVRPEEVAGLVAASLRRF